MNWRLLLPLALLMSGCSHDYSGTYIDTGRMSYGKPMLKMTLKKTDDTHYFVSVSGVGVNEGILRYQGTRKLENGELEGQGNGMRIKDNQTIVMDGVGLDFFVLKKQ